MKEPRLESGGFVGSRRAAGRRQTNASLVWCLVGGPMAPSTAGDSPLLSPRNLKRALVSPTLSSANR